MVYVGRWGKSDSPAFGELKDYYLFYLKVFSNVFLFEFSMALNIDFNILAE